MNALLVYPRFPVTYWGFQYSLRLVGKRASLPPLGLLTVAALLPSGWQVRLVDLILFTQKYLVPRMEQDLEEIRGPCLLQTTLSNGMV